MGLDYAELQCISNFSFLHGGSHPEEYVERAADLGYSAVAITDINSFASVVRGFFAAKESNIKYIVGTKLRAKKDEPYFFDVLAYPLSRKAYGNICTLLSKGNLRANKGDCLFSLEEISAIQDEIIFIVLPPDCIYGHGADLDLKFKSFEKQLSSLQASIIDKNNIYLGLNFYYSNQEEKRLKNIHELSKRFNLKLAATNQALYHSPERKPLQDIITCIKEHVTVNQAGFLLTHNSERYLKPKKEIYRLYRKHPEAIYNALKIAERINFSLEELKYDYPSELIPEGFDSFEYLTKLTYEGANERYGGAVPEKVLSVLKKELKLIKSLNYQDYFITCYDIVKFARSRDILCQGRGAAANSAVCYCLGITAVDPNQIELLFERFVSKARNEPPDIDIDFEHERREEVMQYIYDKYGRHRAGLVSNVITYKQRGAIRETGKALGYPLPVIDAVTSLIHRWNDCKVPKSEFLKIGLNPEDLRFKNWVKYARRLKNFPRHLSQHSGGFVISNAPLTETVPILKSAMDSRTIIEWNKDDIDQLGILKIDILALGMLTCIRKAMQYINRKPRYKDTPLTLYNIPQDDSAVYDMLCRADTLGVFQVESRAQMSMLPRLKPRKFYDLVIEAAIVRPGPIHGNMVHPYLKRRSGIEPVIYPNEKIKQILEKTLGVPLFQEQAMRLVIVAADFTPDEAEKLRRSIAAWKRNEKNLAYFYKRIKEGMLKNGYSEEFIDNCLTHFKGFSEYGFPESHSASFAILVYASSWIKHYHHAEFTCALLNSQPMGFYAPAQIIRDAIKHDVKVEPVDILTSNWDSEVFSENTIRLGFRVIKGLAEKQANAIIALRDLFPKIESLEELYAYSHFAGLPLRKDTLAAIARADGFRSFGLNQREALWLIKGLPSQSKILDIYFKDTTPALPAMTVQESMFSDYKNTGFSLKAHPIQFFRERLKKMGVLTSEELKTVKNKTVNKISGLVICRQRPETAKGTVFLTLEDEFGITNLIVWPKIYEKYCGIIVSAAAVIALGRVEKTDGVMHTVVTHIESIDDWESSLTDSGLEVLSYSY